jgi:inosine-uridine nucleoside N-ribohydrolase
VGLDTTMFPAYRMSRQMYGEMIKPKTKRSKLIEGLCAANVEKYNGFSLHDPMAMAYVADPTMFRLERYNVEVETRGEHTMGMTVVDRRRFAAEANAKAAHQIVVEVDALRFHGMIMDRVGKGG